MDAVNLESILQFVPGCIALLAGKNIFWLFIALAGFFAGFELARIWLADSALVLQIAAALVMDRAIIVLSAPVGIAAIVATFATGIVEPTPAVSAGSHRCFQAALACGKLTAAAR